MLDPDLVTVVAARFKVLGDPGRLAILNALGEGETGVKELVALTGRSQPNVSQNLQSLARAGLVAARRQGNRAFYHIADPYVRELCEAVCSSLAAQAKRQRRLVRRLGAPRRVRRPTPPGGRTS